jgi:hypothetical protein
MVAAGGVVVARDVLAKRKVAGSGVFGACDVEDERRGAESTVAAARVLSVRVGTERIETEGGVGDARVVGESAPAPPAVLLAASLSVGFGGPALFAELTASSTQLKTRTVW